jgi:LysR family pca operon transcriptional activator
LSLETTKWRHKNGGAHSGGSVGISSNASLPLSLAAQWCVDVLRE